MAEQLPPQEPRQSRYPKPGVFLPDMDNPGWTPDQRRVLEEAGNMSMSPAIMRTFDFPEAVNDTVLRAERRAAAARVLQMANDYYGVLSPSGSVRVANPLFDVSLVPNPADENAATTERKIITAADFYNLVHEVEDLREIVTKQNELIQKLIRDKQGINITELV